MPADPYQWLVDILATMLPELDKMPKGSKGQAYATAWFNRLRARFEHRGLKTPYQQRNHVVSTRNAIRQRFGNDHPSLQSVGFDAATWQQINLVGHDRAEARSIDQLFITKPERIVDKATQLLASSHLEDIAVGLGVVTGRRFVEVLDGTGVFTPATAWSIRFSGQRKRGNRSPFDYEIPTLAAAGLVLSAYERLRVMVGSDARSDKAIANRYNTRVNEAANHHFGGMLPVPIQAPRSTNAPGANENPLEESLAAPTLTQEESKGEPSSEDKTPTVFVRLFRAAYATIAVYYYAPPKVNRQTYMAEIQGHRQDLEALPTEEQRRSYTASRFYDYYKIADASGTNIDGRQGIMLGKLPDLKVIAAFEHVPLSLIDVDEDSVASPSPAEGSATFHPSPSSPLPSEVTMSSPDVPEVTIQPADQGQNQLDASHLPPLPNVKHRTTRQLSSLRVHPEDKQWMEEARRQEPKASQHDFLHRLLSLAAHSSQFEEAARQVPNLAAELRTLKAENTALQAKIDTHAAGVGRQLTELLDAVRAPRLNIPGQSSDIAGDLLDLAMKAGDHPLKDDLISMARRMLGGQTAPGVAASSTRASSSPVAPKASSNANSGTSQPLVPTAPRSSSDADPSSTDTPGAGGTLQPADGADSAGATVNTPVRRPGSAYDRANRVITAIMDHNDKQTAKDQKWHVSETFISTKYNISRPALKSYFHDHGGEIEAHNLRHDLGDGHNSIRGRQGGDIKLDVP